MNDGQFLERAEIIRVLAVEVLLDVRVELRQPDKVLSIDQTGRPTVVCSQGLVKIVEAIDETTEESIIPLKRFR